MKLIIFPLFIMVMLSIASFYGLRTEDMNDQVWFDQTAPVGFSPEGVWCDSTNKAIWDGSDGAFNASYPTGIVSGDSSWETVIWVDYYGSMINQTYYPHVVIGHPLYGNTFTYVNASGNFELHQANEGSWNWISAFSINSPYQTIALVLVMAFFVFFLGLRILMSGTSEVSVKFITVAVMCSGLWLFLTMAGYGLIYSIPFGIGFVGYFLLTVMYSLGIMQVGVGGGD